MANLDTLPPEILLIIAKFCGYVSSGQDISQITLAHRDFASLALVNRRLRDVFDPILWRFNARHGVYNENTLPTVSAVYWAASRNRIDILEKALRYRHPLGSYLRRDPIHRAAANGQNAACSWLLDHGVPIDYTPSERVDVDSPFPVPPWPRDHVSPDCSPLFTAITKRKESTAILLLKRGARFRFKTQAVVNSALHLAAIFGLPMVIEYLVKAMGVDVNLLDYRRETPLHYAVQRRHNGKIILTLLNLGADINAEQNFQLPLTKAIMMGHFSNAMLLVDAGARVNPTNTNRDTLSPLIVCTWSEDKYDTMDDPEDFESTAQQDEVLRKLIAKGADLNGSFGGETPLCTAIEEGTISALFELLKAGADITKPREADGMTPFDLVWRLDDPVEDLTAKACLLVAAGARLDTPSPDKNGNTQLEHAIDYCIGEDPRPLEAILRLATSQNMYGGYLDELLEFCLLSRYLDPAKMLVYHGASYPEASVHAFSWALQLNQEPDAGHQAFSFCLDFLSKDQLKFLLHDAIRGGNERHCQVLISRGTISVSEDSEPWLHLAARSGSTALVRRLISAGMDIDALDDKFETPMMAALKCGEAAVAELLFEVGADPFHPRPDAECRRLPNMSTQILSPFEFAIRENRPVDIRKWWINSPPESRPKEEIYIPRVLDHGPWLCRFLKFLRCQSSSDSSEFADEDMELIRRFDMQKFDKDSERILRLMRTMQSLTAVPKAYDEY
ncbi:ankyrin [Hypoxylon sp. NC0597]|nr:ankyrin [Hypoxylon sp. NC0597]